MSDLHACAVSLLYHYFLSCLGTTFALYFVVYVFFVTVKSNYF